MTVDTLSDGSYRRGVGAMLINKRGEVFVGQRIDTSGDAWQMPQGGVKRGEDPSAAVLRELEEEIGTNKVEIVAQSDKWRRYDLPSEIAGKMWKGRYKGQTMKWFVLTFLGCNSDIKVDAVAHPEFSKWRWIDPAELPGLIVSFKKPLYEELLVEFGSLLRRMAAR